MNSIIKTNQNDWAALFARLAVAIAVFPHGAQKLFGWFGGNGFDTTIEIFTTYLGIPYFLVVLVLVVEVFGSVFLALGLWTRLAAAAIALNFIGVLYVDIWGNGFFMNWGKIEGQGEGLEYFILLFGLIIVSLISEAEKQVWMQFFNPKIKIIIKKLKWKFIFGRMSDVRFVM